MDFTNFISIATTSAFVTMMIRRQLTKIPYDSDLSFGKNLTIVGLILFLINAKNVTFDFNFFLFVAFTFIFNVCLLGYYRSKYKKLYYDFRGVFEYGGKIGVALWAVSVIMHTIMAHLLTRSADYTLLIYMGGVLYAQRYFLKERVEKLQWIHRETVPHKIILNADYYEINALVKLTEGSNIAREIESQIEWDVDEYEPNDFQ